jgi:iron(II)-dependent oxidoreductase
MTKKIERKLETPKIMHDAPLRDDDLASFHFDEFARTLARLIATQETRTPLTICISGPWGSGKTTLLKRVRKMLQATETLENETEATLLSFANPQDAPQQLFRVCRTVEFDAWKYAGEDQLLAALLRVIVAEMQKGSFWQKVKTEFAKPKNEEVRWLGLLLHGLTKFASAGAYELNLRDFKDDTPFKEAPAFFDYFDDSLNRLLASWVDGKILTSKQIDEKHGALVIFIDDLDRCLPAKTVQVLEAVKLFLDKPGCVFVLGADADLVNAAVTSHYKAEGIAEFDAKNYLEKIIQLRFELPPLFAKDMQAFIESANECIDPEIASNWQRIVIGAEINPRKVKTFINDLNLQWSMLRNSGQAEGVHRDDFTCWQILMRAAPDNFIRRVRDLDDLELRRKFIGDALKWMQGEAEAAASFKEYENSLRLKRVLRAIAFSDQFTAEVLDAFVHLTAPPVQAQRPAKPIAEVEEEAETPFVREKVISRGAVRAEKGMVPETGQRILRNIEFVRVPQGKFIMGSKEDDSRASDDEKPQHTLEIPYDFWIARYPVTNDQFAQFAETNNYVTMAEKEGGWSTKESKYVKGYDWRHPQGGKSNIKDKGDHPVVQVSWHDAVAYCQWLHELLKGEIGTDCIRLPSEAEWEKAARGEYGNQWPWGNEFDKAKCNSAEGGKGGTTPVGAFSPQGDSPYGAADMAGNVWEWTRSLWKDYPYESKDDREDMNAPDTVLRVLRGGSYLDPVDFARCSFRYWGYPYNGYWDFGFRLVLSLSLL